MGGRPVQLVVENVCKAFDTPTGPLVVLRDVSFELSAGETLAVVGPSGAGKSTLLNIIGSLERPTSGSVRLGGVEVTELAGDDLARFRSQQIGFVFQDHHLLPQCTALENVMLPTLAAHSSDDAAERATALLERVGLAERTDHFPAQLSGGERQRVAVARALANDPDIILADEPTGNLDTKSGREILKLFESLNQYGKTLILVTHDERLASHAKRIIHLLDGKINQDYRN